MSVQEQKADQEFKDQTMLDEMLYAREAEVNAYGDLMEQRGTPIPALFNVFYKFIQNPSSVSVETFKRMVDTDDTIGSGTDFLTTCLAARLGDYTHPSQEISQWVNERLTEIEGGWHNSVKEQLSATWCGFSVTEKMWGNTDNGFVPKRLVTLPPSTILFEVNRIGDIMDDGILQFQRNYNPAMLGMGSMYLFGFSGPTFAGNGVNRPDAYAKFGDLPFPLRTGNTFSYMSIRIPRTKVIHYAFDAQGKFGNPYGRSLLRRGYDWWVMKKAFMQMLATALDRKGTPLTVVYADQNTTLLDSTKRSQNNNAGVDGRQKGIPASLAAKNAFANIHNDSTIILPGKKGQIFDTDFIQQTANQDSFIQAIELCNKSMMRAMLIPSLVFSSGDGTGSFALGQEHAKTFDKILDSMLSGMKQTLIHQLIKEMIAYNFPRSAWEKDGLGEFGSRELTTEERDKEMDVVEKATNIGAIDINDLNDLNKIREKAGFEPLHKVPERPEMAGMLDGEMDDESDGDDDTEDKPDPKKKKPAKKD